MIEIASLDREIRPQVPTRHQRESTLEPPKSRVEKEPNLAHIRTASMDRPNKSERAVGHQTSLGSALGLRLTAEHPTVTQVVLHIHSNNSFSTRLRSNVNTPKHF
jgi:hypothetical protein